jgi:hypothetical protein
MRRITPPRLTWNPIKFPQESGGREAIGLATGNAMTELPGQEDRTGDLRELSDPEFFTQWAAARNRLFITPKGKPEHSEIKRWYDAVAAEYRRRIDGGLAVMDANN